MAPPSLLIQTGKGEMETRAPLRPSLNLVQFAIAQQWAFDQKLSSNSIVQLQEILGIPATGIYDDLTIEAVYDQQVRNNEGWEEHAKRDENGIADKAFFQGHGLILTKQVAKAKVTPGFLQQFFDENGIPREAFKNGVSIACYTNYNKEDVDPLQIKDSFIQSSDSTTNNIKPFAEAATTWANENKAIGMNDKGELQIGAPLKITETRELIEMLQSISQGLKEMFLSTCITENEGGEDSGEVPAWVKVKTLSLYARGTSFGVCTDASGRFSEGLLSDQPDDESYDEKGANLGSFVESLRGILASNVSVHLFAGNTAKAFDEDELRLTLDDDQKEISIEDNQGSYNSFAAWLQMELGEEATVFGQLADWKPTTKVVDQGWEVGLNDKPNATLGVIAFGKLAGAEEMSQPGNPFYPNNHIDEELKENISDPT